MYWCSEPTAPRLLKSLTLLVAVTIANVIGIRSLPLPKFSHFWNVLSSSGRHHISPTGLTFAIGSHFFLNWNRNSFHELSVKWWNVLLLDNFLGIGVSPSHLPIYSCSSFQPPENTRDNQQNRKKKKKDFPSEDYITFIRKLLIGGFRKKAKS